MFAATLPASQLLERLSVETYAPHRKGSTDKEIP